MESLSRREVGAPPARDEVIAWLKSTYAKRGFLVLGSKRRMKMGELIPPNALLDVALRIAMKECRWRVIGESNAREMVEGQSPWETDVPRWKHYYRIEAID